MFVIAIYSRKSKFSEKGDSVENQIQFCKDYANMHFKDAEIEYIIYEDEGFSAATTNRPQFKLLLEDIKAGKINMLMCYRLDRISRNVADFSDTLELLVKHDVSFVSATENFDTSTPMGKAMIYIASVFAQLERETIAERIRDNMLALAKTGRWLGGNPPLGYRSESTVYIDGDFKERKLYNLIPDESGLKTASLLFTKYLEMNSLSQVEAYCLSNNIKTQKNCDFTKGTISMIVENPTYCIADQAAYDYFTSLGCIVCDDKAKYNGKHGLMCYNRTSQQKGFNKRLPDEWIIAIGKHKGIVPGADYVKIQGMIQHNKSKSNFRSETSNVAALSGMITCAECGSKLRVKSVQRKKTGTLYYYCCEMKVLSKGSRCKIKNLPGMQFEYAVINTIKELLSDTGKDNEVKQYLRDKEKMILTADYSDNIKSLESEYSENEKSIHNLLEQLSKSDSSIVAKYVTPKLEELDARQSEIKNELNLLKNKKEYITNEQDNINLLYQNLMNFNHMIDKADINQKKYLLRTIIKNITWDGEYADIELFNGYSLHYSSNTRSNQYG